MCAQQLFHEQAGVLSVSDLFASMRLVGCVCGRLVAVSFQWVGWEGEGGQGGQGRQ
jgi:hypothetical protein